MSQNIRVALPFHLRNIANVGSEIALQVKKPITLGAVLDAIEINFPMLRGTIRDHVTKERRPFLRFFVCGKDISLEPPGTPLPEAVVRGEEPFLVIGSIAGG